MFNKRAWFFTLMTCLGLSVGAAITGLFTPEYDFAGLFHMCWGAATMTLTLNINGLIKDE